MAYVHTSVNTTSKQYFQIERRYNYTTPKSFLEQISLYMKLLENKHDELSSKIKRLENGLEKLNSTALQVADLKKTLAIQEIELKEKNDAADALIEIVRVETEKVQVSISMKKMFNLFAFPVYSAKKNRRKCATVKCMTHFYVLYERRDGGKFRKQIPTPVRRIKYA